MSEADDNVLAFAPKEKPDDASIASEAAPSDRDVIMQTLENVMDAQEQLEKGMKLAVQVIAELQSHVRDLEHDVAQLKKPKRAVILNSQGARAN